MVFDNIITRLLGKHEYPLSITYIKHDRKTDPSLEIDLGSSGDPFETNFLPSDFSSKCIIQKDKIEYALSASS